MIATSCRMRLTAIVSRCLASVAVFLATTYSVVAADEGASIIPTSLRCEYLENPLGIDVTDPRMSWVLAPTDPRARGMRQTAYQILVASSPETLAEHQGDRWDSGWVESDEQTHIVYEGRRLLSDDVCHWKVRVRDEDGVVSAWSEPASWSMGILSPDEWTAQWIGADREFTKLPGWPPPDNTMPDPWLRRTIVLPAKPVKAQLHVASVGYHELYINGERVDDAVLSPCVSDHKQRARYITYDIAPMLDEGKNVVALWLGTSWSIFPSYQTEDKPATPLAIAQGDVQFGQGAKIRIATDGSWKLHDSPNTLLGVWDFMHFGGELYDANQELPGWNTVELDDSNWQNATVYQPELKLSAQMVEKNKLFDRLDAVAVDRLDDGSYRVDMGRNFAGFVEFDIRGTQGQRVEFEYSEHPEAMMTHRIRSAYIIGPSGEGTFRNRFNYSSGRWIHVKGLEEKPRLADVRGWVVRTAYEKAHEFYCSDPLLQKIHDTTMWTLDNLSVGGYVVDCPQRERMGYGGDAHATTDTALSHYHLGAFYTKWNQDWHDLQGKTASWGTGENKLSQDDPEAAGNIPYTAPTYWGGGGPAWSGYCVTLPWKLYTYYGDRRILEESLPVIERWLAFLESHSENDMLVRWGGKWDFLGDWLWPGASGVNGDTRETLFFNNCYWIYNLQTAADIAEVVGRADLASAWDKRADEVRKAVHTEFYLPREHSYVNGFQAYLAAALLADVMPPKVKAQVWDRFEKEIVDVRRGHVHAGITGGYFLTKAVLEFDRPDLMYLMATQTDYPGWGEMLENGATTIHEDWESNKSRLHSSYLWVGWWYMRGLAGIMPRAPGFERFAVIPGVYGTAPLAEVSARYDSLQGTIASHWTIEGGTIRLRVTVPPNTQADIRIPTADPEAVRECGRPLRAQDGIEDVRVLSHGRWIAVAVQPGTYEFTAPCPDREPLSSVE